MSRGSVVERQILPTDQVLTVLAEVYGAHGRSERILGLLGQALEQARDIDLPNAPPPEHPLFLSVIDALTGLVAKAKGTEAEATLLEGLSTAARNDGATTG